MEDIINSDDIQLSIQKNGNYKLIFTYNLKIPITIEASNKKEVIRLLSKELTQKKLYNALSRKKIIQIIKNKFIYLKVFLIED